MKASPPKPGNSKIAVHVETDFTLDQLTAVRAAEPSSQAAVLVEEDANA